MSIGMEEEIKFVTARRGSAVVLEILQVKITVGEANQQLDLTRSRVPSVHFIKINRKPMILKKYGFVQDPEWSGLQGVLVERASNDRLSDIQWGRVPPGFPR